MAGSCRTASTDTSGLPGKQGASRTSQRPDVLPSPTCARRLHAQEGAGREETVKKGCGARAAPCSAEGEAVGMSPSLLLAVLLLPPAQTRPVIDADDSSADVNMAQGFVRSCGVSLR